MNWHFLNTGFNTGNYNMAFDIHLSSLCKPDEAFLRFYRWKPFCISLGLNQSRDSIKTEKAKKDNIDIVKRPTGGRAILHAEELTYSVIMPVEQNSSPKNIYKEINTALALGLKIYDKDLSSVELEESQPNFREVYKEKGSDVCFAVSAKSELKYRGKKLAGSAQHRFGNIILQHGSILCGEYHKKIVDYLDISDKEYDLTIKLLNQTADLYSISGEDIDYQSLINSLRKGFELYFNIDFYDPGEEDFSFAENELSY
jgi:lipoyl(octanoyl) transferase